MLKFARHFFLFFLITTVIPLLTMYAWSHYKMNQMEDERNSHFLEVGAKQLLNSTKEYLKTQESKIITELKDSISDNDIIAYFKKKHPSSDIEIKAGELKESRSYYIIATSLDDKQNLYTITTVPLGKKYLKIKQLVNLDVFRPIGPFEVDVYAGETIQESFLIGTIFDPFLTAKGPGFHDVEHNTPEHMSMIPKEFSMDDHRPPPHDMFAPPPPPNMHMKPFRPVKDIDRKPVEIYKKDKQVQLVDENLNVIATFVLKTFKNPDPIQSINIFQNGLGLIILFAGSILSLFVGLYINNNFIKPLLMISNATKQIQYGNMSFKLDTNIKQEQILNTFNNFNKMVKGLREKEHLRQSFITSLTHDLKTPLIAQERSLDLIAQEFEELGLKDPYDLAVGIKKNNNHLLRMVNLILESYRFDSEALELDFEELNMSELIDNCIDNTKPLLIEKNIKISNNINKGVDCIVGDKTSLTRVFVNLISNSIENMDPNGQIEIDAEDSENFITITVKDNGFGIAKEDLKHLFERYFTGKSDERKLGSGLGLYVCKKLIKLHDGYISVDSVVNEFTKFTIELPKHRIENGH